MSFSIPWFESNIRDLVSIFLYLRTGFHGSHSVASGCVRCTRAPASFVFIDRLNDLKKSRKSFLLIRVRREIKSNYQKTGIVFKRRFEISALSTADEGGRAFQDENEDRTG